jgi:hypothetical protein
MNTYSGTITELKPNQIFVFGSNLAGRHGLGAALQARIIFGAEYGIGEGRTGQTYAIPTKDFNIRKRNLKDVVKSIQLFIEYANEHPELEFLVTRIGCGLAGFEPEEMAAAFNQQPIPDNILFEENFATLLITLGETGNGK